MTAAGRVYGLGRRIRNGLGYIVRGDFEGLRSRLRSIKEDQFLQNCAVSGPPKHWGVMSTPPSSKLTNHDLPLPHDISHIALSMPETIARRRIVEANQPQNCAVFDGVRSRPGRIDCGLSYSRLVGKPLVSVILPSYNHAEYVGRAVQSVLDQTFRDLELIVVDDGPTDGTADVVASIRDPRLTLIR